MQTSRQHLASCGYVKDKEQRINCATSYFPLLYLLKLEKKVLEVFETPTKNPS
jgi:hypothetical protein